MNPQVRIARRQLRMQLAKRGIPVLIRRVAISAGPSGQKHPPAAVGVVVDGSHVAGATVLNLRATRLVGRFLAGDQIWLGAGPPWPTVKAETLISEDEPKVALPLQQPLPEAIPDGRTVVGFGFVGDIKVTGRVVSYPARLIDGTMIVASDREVMLSAEELGGPPSTQDQIFFTEDADAGQTDAVVHAVTTDAAFGYAIGYRVQARRA